MTSKGQGGAAVDIEVDVAVNGAGKPPMQQNMGPPSFGKGNAPPSAAVGRGDAPCRHGMDCWGLKDGSCKFKHERKRCRYGADCKQKGDPEHDRRFSHP